MPSHTTRCMLLAAFGAGLALAGCDGRDASHSVPETLVVRVHEGRLTMDSSRAKSPTRGWQTLRVEEDGAGHIVVAYRLPVETTDAALQTFLATFDDTTGITPAPAVALGGPEVGDSGEVVIEFTPGHYVLACLRRNKDGHRHGVTGEMVHFVVTESSPVSTASSVAPTADLHLTMHDFAYTGEEEWSAGAHVLRVENVGRQDHQLRIDRLRDGVTLRDWLTTEAEIDSLAESITGIARMGTGAMAYLSLTLVPGRYVAHCLVPDPRSGAPHVEMGMIREIIVR